MLLESAHGGPLTEGARSVPVMAREEEEGNRENEEQ